MSNSVAPLEAAEQVVKNEDAIAKSARPGGISKADLEYRLRRVKTQHLRLIELCIYLPYLFAFVFITSNQQKIKRNFIVREIVRRDLIEQTANYVDGGKNQDVPAFAEVTSLNEVMNWMEYVLIPIIYPEEYYNGSVCKLNNLTRVI